jgi:hypothetical protein
MRRRFLKCLEQGIESIARQHVDFVDNIDLVARRHRRVADLFDDLAHVVHAGIGGRVHLDHVDMAALGNRSAGFAHAARVDGRPALPVRPDAVQRLGDQPRGRGLADPAHARHQEGMRQPVTRDGIGKGAHHRFLPDQLGKGLRPVFAREHAVGLAPRCRRRANRRWRGRLWLGNSSVRRHRIAEQRILPRRLKLGSGRPGFFLGQFGIGIAHCAKLGARAQFVMRRASAMS